MPEDANFRATDPYWIEKFSNPNLEDWITERDAAREAGIRYGLEIGSPLADLDRAAFVTAHTQPDFIIGSIHSCLHTQDFCYLKKDAPDAARLQARYFSELIHMATTCDFDVIGHLTYPWRYITLPGEAIDVMRHEDLLRALFRALAERGLGIEINTSGLRKSSMSYFGRCLPELELVKLYRACGGEILTLGSDAHYAADVGSGLHQAHDIAKAAGFTRAAFFTDRKPVFYDL
jgi:histidinol-phosphatase (PHP family)